MDKDMRITPRSDMAAVPRKVVYFHENQLCYPVRERKDRDFQYGYNQILTALTADEVIFNSEYNMNSFLGHLDDFFRLQPDYREAFHSLLHIHFDAIAEFSILRYNTFSIFNIISCVREAHAACVYRAEK